MNDINSVVRDIKRYKLNSTLIDLETRNNALLSNDYFWIHKRIERRTGNYLLSWVIKWRYRRNYVIGCPTEFNSDSPDRQKCWQLQQIITWPERRDDVANNATKRNNCKNTGEKFWKITENFKKKLEEGNDLRENYNWTLWKKFGKKKCKTPTIFINCGLFK